MRHEVTKDFTQNVKAKFMGCFWVIVKSPNKMKLKSAWQIAKEKEIKNIRSGWFNVCFLFLCVCVLYLPSLLKLLSDVTAFTKSGTSVQVLEPSQWARQTAPLPSIQIMADNKNAIPNFRTRKTKAHNIHILIEQPITSVSQHNQMAGGGIIRPNYGNTVCNRWDIKHNALSLWLWILSQQYNPGDS